MPPEERKKADRSIFNAAAKIISGMDGQILYCYVSSPELEVDTISLLKYALEKGWQVAVPRCIKGITDLEHCRLDDLSQLEKGTFGIMEPSRDCIVVNPPHKGICIVPGLAFGSDGKRLGYGKGYYDRFLSGFSGKKIGLCYDSCFFPEGIPAEEHDAAMDIIITESGAFTIKGNKGGRSDER